MGGSEAKLYLPKNSGWLKRQSLHYVCGCEVAALHTCSDRVWVGDDEYSN